MGNCSGKELPRDRSLSAASSHSSLNSNGAKTTAKLKGGPGNSADSPPRASVDARGKGSDNRSSTSTRNASVSESTSSGKPSTDLNEKIATLERLMDDKMGKETRRLTVNSKDAAALSVLRQEEPEEEDLSTPDVGVPAIGVEVKLVDVSIGDQKPPSSSLPTTPLHAKSRSSSSQLSLLTPQKKNFRERAISQPFPKVNSRRSSGGASKANSFPVFFENLLSMGTISVQLASDSRLSPFLKKRLYQVVHDTCENELAFVRYLLKGVSPQEEGVYEELTETEEELIALCEDFKRECDPSDLSLEEFYPNFAKGIENVVTVLCTTHKTVQLSFIHRVEKGLDLMNRATEVLKETMNNTLEKKQAELVEEKSNLVEQILLKLIESLRSMALNAQDDFISQTFWSYAASLSKICGRIKTKVNVFLQDSAWDSGKQEQAAHEVIMIIQELQEAIDDISAALDNEATLIERNQYKHLFDIALESFQAGTSPEKATEVQILKDKLSAVKKVEFYEAATEQDVFATVKSLAAKIDQITNGIEELEASIEEQDFETSPSLLSLTALLLGKLETSVFDILEVVLKGWEVKVTAAEVQNLKTDFSKLVKDVTERTSTLELEVAEHGFQEKTKLELILLARDVLGVTAIASLLLPYVTSDPSLQGGTYPLKTQGISLEDLEEKLRPYEKTTERLNDRQVVMSEGKFMRTSMLFDLDSKKLDAMRRQSLLSISESANIWVNHNGKPMPKEGNIWNEKGSVQVSYVNGREVVMAGTLNQLVTHFTSAKTNQAGGSALAGSDFSTTFMITFQTFTTPEIFFEKLRERYQVPDCPEFLFMDEQEYEREYKKPIKIRVCNIMKKWITTRFDQDLAPNPKLVENLFDFIETDVSKDSELLATNLKNTLLIYTTNPGSRRKSVIRAHVQLTVPEVTSGEMYPRFELLTRFNVRELAQQITLLDEALYKSIRLLELTGEDRKNKEKSPNVHRFIDFSNNVSGWVAKAILMEQDIKDRAKVMSNFVGLCDYLKSIRNFNSMMGVLAGLTISAVNRLKQTQKLMPPNSQKLYQQLQMEMAAIGSFKVYREILRNGTGPCIPFMGVTLSDITFTEDGNSDYTKEGLINWTKRTLLFSTLSQFMEHQKSCNYDFVETPMKESFLRRVQHAMAYEEDLYELSLELEPLDSGVKPQKNLRQSFTGIKIPFSSGGTS